MIFITGAAGFVGGHLVDYLLSRKLRFRCLVRSSVKAEGLSLKGAETVIGDVTRRETLSGALGPDDIVVHLVGIIEEKGGATFSSVHVEGTANLVAEARKAGVSHFFYQSALGADRGSWSGYLRTKALAEEIVTGSGLGFTIFRPSLIIGPWDGFTKKITDMLKLSPVLPIPGEGGSKFQPIYIRDWLKCIGKVLDAPGQYKSAYDIGGPEHLTYRQIVKAMSEAMGYSKPEIKIPMGLMRFSASLLGMVLPSPPVTPDQLRLLDMDNVCDPQAVERYFGFSPMRLEDALHEFIKS